MHAPDTQSSYSNANYIVLGLVVERVTGKRLEEVLQERIFAPSGMSDTSLAKARVTDPPGYAAMPDGATSRTDDLSSAWAAGGVVSSARDLDAFLTGLTSERPDTEAFEDMARPRGELRNRGNIEYGLGLGRRHVRCATVVGHGGAIPGFLTEAWSSEDGERAVVAMVSDEGSYTVLDGLLTTALCG